MEIFAGLGLFFVGIKLIGANLKQMTGGWLRLVIERATRHAWRSTVAGFVLGALTQSSNAITFISINMVAAGLASVAQVLPLVIWGNVGTSALVFLSAVDLHLIVLFLIGSTGIAFYFDVDRSPKYRHGLSALLGLGLLFLGLELIKVGAQPLKSMPAVRDVLDFSAQSYGLAFIMGVAITIIAQSSATISVIAVTLVNAGLLSLDQTIAIVIGASVGSGMSIALLSTNLSGVGRQLALLQVTVKFAGAGLAIPVLAVELAGLGPGLKAMSGVFGTDPAFQVAMVYFLLQILGAFFVGSFQVRMLELAAWASPATQEEELSHPRFIYPEALGDPDTAVQLVRLEQQRIVAFLPELLAYTQQADAHQNSKMSALSASGHALGRHCDNFLTEILDRNPSRELLDDAIGLKKRLATLTSLIDTVEEFVTTMQTTAPLEMNKKLDSLLFALRESLEMILHVAGDAVGSDSRDDRDQLVQLTSGRSGQMEAIRQRILDLDTLSPIEHRQLYASTTLFERALWLVQRLLRSPDEKTQD